MSYELVMSVFRFPAIHKMTQGTRYIRVSLAHCKFVLSKVHIIVKFLVIHDVTSHCV